ncbi:anti-sigma factor RsbA family regulatory protein [Streptomyces sp. NPDC020379]|uniref:anti-sigma factor RsbA family regulatory protein n=1 Tax=Streptomyces sp. NPDC020379 TaxID=3365071 RepID=UPI00378CC285
MPAEHGGPDEPAGPGRGFVHHACLYGSDAEFLAMAVPFVRAGLAAGEPVLAATTSANIELLRAALGDGARALDTAETAYFGRRPVERVLAFLRYHERRARPGLRMRMIAEPVWSGRSARQRAEWKRMESGLNLLLAALPLWMVCPYDTRTVPADVIEAACATHPARLDGEHVTPCAAYRDPAAYTASPPPPDPPPPASAVLAPPTADPAALRRFARARAAAAGLGGERLALAELAVHEAADHLLEAAEGARVTLSAWQEPGALVYDLWRPGPHSAPVPALAGYLPPGADRGGEDGLWLARRLSDFLDVRLRDGGTRITLRVAGPTDAEAL